MSKNTAIKVENLAKQYRLGQVGTGTIRHDINRWWHLIRGKEDPYLKIGESNDRASKGNSEYVWALKGINFEVEKGETLGIIGKNGAGKSTLLKLLSKVTSPSTGAIKTKGRIASLLEVGTGFHPEMTGRENIYMNGTIMGMSRQEISAKLDEIVQFAGIERYLDTPVKRYSSGMTVRLGFSIAAHLEPEILIVDEVLAVGDAEFQKKAIGKMQDVSKGEGRTVLFVSHNMASVEALCTKGILLENGKISFHGMIQDTINNYLTTNAQISDINTIDRKGLGNFQIRNIRVKNERGEYVDEFGVGENLDFELDYIGNNDNLSCNIIIGIYDAMSVPVARFDSFVSGDILRISKEGKLICSCNNLNLSPGSYFLNIALFVNGELEDHILRVKRFDLVPNDYFGSGKIFENNLTKVYVKHSWKSI